MAYYMWKTTSASLTSASLHLCILMGAQSCSRQVSLLNDCFVSQLCWRASKGCRAEWQEGTHLRLGTKRKKRRGGGRQHFRSWLFYGCLAHDSSFLSHIPFLSRRIFRCERFWLKVMKKRFWPQSCSGRCFHRSPQSLRSDSSEWHIWEYGWYLKSETSETNPNFTLSDCCFKHEVCNLS